MPKLPAFDAKSIVKPEDRQIPERSTGGERPGFEYTWFTCVPEIIYPAVIARIREVLKSGEFPNELVDLNSPAESDPRGVARTYLAQAKELPSEAWKWALQEHDRFYKNYLSTEIAMRRQALDIARRWFTQALHVQHGGDGTPMGVHWTNNPAFRA